MLLVGASAGARTTGEPASNHAMRSRVLPANRPVAISPGANAAEQIVVTANKHGGSQRKVAISVAAISDTELAPRQDVNLEDLAAQVPGLSLEADDKTAVRVVLRGLNTGASGATVASVPDDVPADGTGAQNNSATNTLDVDT